MRVVAPYLPEMEAELFLRVGENIVVLEVFLLVHITDSPACSILTSSNNDNYNCFFLSMKAFQGLLPTDKSCLDDSNSLVSIKKATHELLWKYLRGHLKRDQTLQVRFLFLVELWYTRSDVGSPDVYL